MVISGTPTRYCAVGLMNVLQVTLYKMTQAGYTSPHPVSFSLHLLPTETNELNYSEMKERETWRKLAAMHLVPL